MTGRHTVDSINDDDLDQLYNQLAALRQVARVYCPHCGRGDAAPTVTDWEQQKQRADQAEKERGEWEATAYRHAKHWRTAAATVTRVHEALASFDGRGVIAIGHVNLDVPTAGEVLDAVRHALDPAATQATDTETTARVIDLYERWVKAGPPPLGVPLARWWDARLAQLHAALDQPKVDQTAGHVYLSTGCYHGRHDYCANVDGIVGLKKPAQCKFCAAPCVCPCHGADGAANEATNTEESARTTPNNPTTSKDTT